MIFLSDVPSIAKLFQLNTIPGSNGSLALSRHMPLLRCLVGNGNPHVQVDSATGSGKSRLVPSVVADALELCPILPPGVKLLVLTTSTVDVKGMQAAATCASCFRMGGRRRGGAPWHRSKIVFATAGLADRWYASDGGGLWDYGPFGAVLPPLPPDSNVPRAYTAIFIKSTSYIDKTHAHYA